MKVKIFKPGRYAGATVNDPQFETEAANEVVEVDPNTAAYLVECENGEIVTEKKSKSKSKDKPKNPAPPDADKDNAETE